MLSYDKMIKDQYKPVPNEKKKMELELLKQTYDPAFRRLQRE